MRRLKFRENKSKKFPNNGLNLNAMLGVERDGLTNDIL